MKQFDNSRPEFSPYGFTCEMWTPARMNRPDRHNEIELNLLLNGSITYLFGGYKTTIESKKLTIFWAAIPHQIVDYENDKPYFVVTFPLCEFLRIGLDLKLVNRILQGELLNAEIHDHFEEHIFRRWEQDLKSGDRALEMATRLETQAKLLRIMQKVSHKPVENSLTMLTMADKLACYIAQNYQQPLTSQIIADAHGLHPNYAMNLFRKNFGTTMTTFINQHRISHAQRLLLTSDDSIMNIALDAGFQSLSRFNEAFKETCGCSPREYRKVNFNEKRPHSELPLFQSY